MIRFVKKSEPPKLKNEPKGAAINGPPKKDVSGQKIADPKIKQSD